MGHYDAFDPTPYRTHHRTLGFLRPESRVLEIGCASGALTEHIQALGCTVVGVERDPEAAEEARSFCERTLVGDIEVMPLDLEASSFDFLLLIDVLEHLVDPKAALRRLLPFVRPSGRVVVALPNVAHWSVRLRLLFGRFEYEESGILDRTHLRWYTLATARMMLEEAGLKDLEADIVPDVPVLRYKPRLARLNYEVARVLPNLFATESLFVGRP
jgi:2-polyprenyl-3-methyl-5-hydroxy-6-metoxy-1,4-benzoquinol methylase